MNPTSTFSLREMRLDLKDMQKWHELIQFDISDDVPSLSAEKMLEKRLRAVNENGRIYFGYVLEIEDQTVGMVTFHNVGELPDLGKPAICFVTVHPEFRRQGCGKQLYESGLEQLRELGFDHCMCGMRKIDNVALAFAEHLGFSEFDRMYHLSLDLTGISEADIPISDDSTMQLFSLAQLRETDSKWLEKLQELSKAFEKDLPSRVGVNELPENLDEFEKIVFSNWNIISEGSFVIIIDDVWVATAWISQPVSGSEWCSHIMTGVRPEFRRRGFVKILKYAGFEWAKETGIRYIHTNQQESNNPMLTLNQNLGFEIKSCYILFQNQL
jgi:GNAT superfamily N-acetyltransferase